MKCGPGWWEFASLFLARLAIQSIKLLRERGLPSLLSLVSCLLLGFLRGVIPPRQIGKLREMSFGVYIILRQAALMLVRFIRKKKKKVPRRSKSFVLLVDFILKELEFAKESFFQTTIRDFSLQGPVALCLFQREEKFLSGEELG